MSTGIAIIGDNFMRADVFESALRGAISDPFTCAKLDLPFPDQPVVQRSESPELAGLREFQGTPEQVVATAAGARILVTHVAPVSRGILRALPDLEMIAVARGGPVNVDVAAVRERGIRLVNTPGRNAGAVAEFTVGAIIAETRNIARGHAALVRGTWRGELYRADVQRRELSAMTVGIVGYSAIGTRVAALLRAFGSRILVTDPYTELRPEDIRHGARMVPLDELLSRSDVVTLHARLTPETRGMIDAGALARMKPGAVLINTARGPMVDEHALHGALARGHLSGAVLDTFDIEPLPAESPLLRLDSVTVTPHIAGASTTTVRVAADMVAREVRRLIESEPPLNAVA